VVTASVAKPCRCSDGDVAAVASVELAAGRTAEYIEQAGMTPVFYEKFL